MRKGMSCTCDLGDGAVPINWCAAHARAYRIAVEAEREACAKIAADACDSAVAQLLAAVESKR